MGIQSPSRLNASVFSVIVGKASTDNSCSASSQCVKVKWLILHYCVRNAIE